MFVIPYSSMRADYGWQHSHSGAVGQEVNILAKGLECASLGNAAACCQNAAADDNSALNFPSYSPLHQGKRYTQRSPASSKQLLLSFCWVLASTCSLATMSRDTKLSSYVFIFESNQGIKCSDFICKHVGLWKDEHQLISGLLQPLKKLTLKSKNCLSTLSHHELHFFFSKYHIYIIKNHSYTLFLNFNSP